MALLVFSGFALFLAGAGVYSVASYAAAARTREIGVRMAIGATAKDVRLLVARQALVPVAIGAFFGLVGAMAAGKGMGRLLFQVEGYDPVVPRRGVDRPYGCGSHRSRWTSTAREPNRPRLRPQQRLSPYAL